MWIHFDCGLIALNRTRPDVDSTKPAPSIRKYFCAGVIRKLAVVGDHGKAITVRPGAQTWGKPHKQTVRE
jgi:hypothetical protein